MSELQEIFAEPLEVDGIMLDLVPETETKSFQGKKFAPRPRLKDSKELEQAIATFFRRQGEQVLNGMKAMNGIHVKAPLPTFFDLGTATEEMFRELLPVLQIYYDHGADDTVSRLGLDSSIKKVVQPKLAAGVQKSTFQFCQSTNETTQKELGDALQELRESLTEGLEAGEVKNALMARVQEVFEGLETSKAFVLGVTEASRAQHNAMMIAGDESGIVKGYKWLLSDDACPVCQEIADTMPEIKSGEVFATLDEGPYGSITSPPAHPSCRCALTEVI